MKAICIAKYRHFKENHLYKYEERLEYTGALTFDPSTYIQTAPGAKILRPIFKINGRILSTIEFNQHFRRFL